MDDLYETTRRKSRYGRKDWLYWRDTAGAVHTAPKTRDGIKAALLACGTKRTFIMLSGGIAHRISWRMGILMWRNARFGI